MKKLICSVQEDSQLKDEQLATEDYASHTHITIRRIASLIDGYFPIRQKPPSLQEIEEYFENILNEYINIFTVPMKIVGLYPNSIVVKICHTDHQWQTILDNLNKAKTALQQEFKNVQHEDFEKPEYSHLRYKSKSKKSLRYREGFSGTPSGARIPDTLIKSQVFY